MFSEKLNEVRTDATSSRLNVFHWIEARSANKSSMLVGKLTTPARHE